MKNSSKHMGKTNWPVTIVLDPGMCHHLFSAVYGCDHCL